MKKDQSESIAPFIWILIVVVLIQVFGAITIIYSFDSWGTRGSFGDMFGVLSSIFTGLAFAAVIYSLYLQRKDLKITQEELKQSVKAQNEQAESLRETALLNALTTLVSSYTELSLHKNKAERRPFAEEYDPKRDKSLEELEKKFQELVDGNKEKSQN
ncbi:hypothetical protein NC796_25090 [Aliifodinibius sp. S!AR15-10]|uniref:hypothetical protein n=1 Tax=Aliifodinibius sp. S!AR15-10 TaxID=2950437 RepID=UPI002854C05C|nr:hypothetical protein [Aliifodinibius sp. S!AR15-10]MDR8394446.1 hypothetical protein [Aliifodinibius sp. S!AR15-10]